MSIPNQSSPASPDESPRPVGRPRDPEVDQRILDAALRVYADNGWAGFTMEQVAQRAHTGKTSLYMRWSSKRELLETALASVTLEPLDTTAPPRERLASMARTSAERLLGPHGVAILRFGVESRALQEEFAELTERISTTPVLDERRWLEKQIASGAITTQRTALEILEGIEGSALVHALVTPPHLVPRVLKGLDTWAERLVDAQLAL